MRFKIIFDNFFISFLFIDHHFFFAKLKIRSIVLLDTFGGPKYISLQEYLHPPTEDITSDFLRWYQSSLVQDGDHDSEESLKEAEKKANFLPSVVLT